MYLITSSDQSAAVLRSMVDIVCPGAPIHVLRLSNDLSLAWANVKPWDNVHIYSDRVVIGKVDFDEPRSLAPIQHAPSDRPPVLHPLLVSTTVIIKADGISVTPNHHAETYYSRAAVSDYQLLIARDEGLQPSQLGAQILSAVGYFPGNLTLFDEISKLPFLETLEFPPSRTVRYDTFQPQAPNDRAMVERLLSIVPNYSESSIALSAGLDSRFVLGLLIRKGIHPTARTRTGEETALVEAVCEYLNLPLLPARYDLEEGYKYTLMTDARIYHRGGNYSQMVREVTDEVMHTGLFAGIIENTFGAAWKKPGRLSTIYSDLIRHALLSTCPTQLNGLHGTPARSAIHEELRSRLRNGESYAEFPTRRQWASWFYYIHRGLNWTPATMSDVSYYVYPVYILGDKIATEYGVTSSAWANFYKERARVLNRQLLPDVPVDYSDGRSWASRPPVVREVHKLWYEYGQQFGARRSGIRKMQGTGENPVAEAIIESHPRLGSYFTRPLDELVNDQSVVRNVKRAAVTLNNVLQYLDHTSARYTKPIVGGSA